MVAFQAAPTEFNSIHSVGVVASPADPSTSLRCLLNISWMNKSKFYISFMCKFLFNVCLSASQHCSEPSLTVHQHESWIDLLIIIIQRYSPNYIFCLFSCFSCISALELIKEAIAKAGYTDEVVIGMDVAASEFYRDGKYDLDFKSPDDPSRYITPDELADLYKSFVKDYPGNLQSFWKWFRAKREGQTI